MNYYEALGLTRTATSAEIRTAYRRIAIKHHPDRSKDPKSVDVFKRAAEAYEILGDDQKRRSYDLRLGVELRRQAEAARKANPFGPEVAAPTTPKPKAQQVATKTRPGVSVTEEVSRLTTLFSRGRHVEAESLARAILDRDPRQPLPYAILGDLSRMEGHRREAAKMYAFAVQMDPRNELYQQRHEEMLAEIKRFEEPQSKRREAMNWNLMLLFVPAAGWAMIAFHSGPGDLAKLPLVSSWSWSMLGWLLGSGASVGGLLARSRWLDHLLTSLSTSLGKPSQVFVFSALAILQFWLALAIYGLSALVRGSHTASLSRFMSTIAFMVVMFTLAGALGTANAAETFLWSGNVMYLGALVGWLIADAVPGPR